MRRVATKKSREAPNSYIANQCKQDILQYVDDAMEYGHSCFTKRGRQKRKYVVQAPSCIPKSAPPILLSSAVPSTVFSSDPVYSPPNIVSPNITALLYPQSYPFCLQGSPYLTPMVTNIQLPYQQPMIDPRMCNTFQQLYNVDQNMRLVLSQIRPLYPNTSSQQ